MKLKIIDKKLITVVNIAMVELDSEDKSFYIWDMCDNKAEVLCEHGYDEAMEVVNKLHSDGNATVFGEINWE